MKPLLAIDGDSLGSADGVGQGSKITSNEAAGSAVGISNDGVTPLASGVGTG